MTQFERPMASVFDEARILDGPLSRRLEFYTSRHRELSPEIAAAYQHIISQLVDAGATTETPRTGRELPPFFLPDDHGRLVSSEALLARGPLVLSLNRGHWCGYCQLELQALGAIAGKLEEMGARIVAITPERQAFTRQLKTELGIDFPVLSDIDNAYALSLGLMMWVGEELQGLMRERGLDISRFQGSQGWFLPVPATFVVGSDGKIRGCQIDPDYRRRMEIEDILATVDAG